MKIEKYVVGVFVFSSLGLPVEAHPGATDASGGHFTDPVNKTGYHRHSSPLYRSNYGTAELRAAERLRTRDGRSGIIQRSDPSQMMMRRSTSKMARIVDQLTKKHERRIRDEEDRHSSLLPQVAIVFSRRQGRVEARMGSDFKTARSGDVLALYRVQGHSLRLVGRARAYFVAGVSMKARILSWIESPEDVRVLPGHLLLSDHPLGEDVENFGPGDFDRFLNRRPWKGMPLELFLAAWGKASRSEERLGSWGSERILRYGARRSRLSHFHFRNGRLVLWMEK